MIYLVVKQSKMLTILILLVLIVLTVFIIRIPIMLSMGNFLIIQDNLHPADVIHIISGLDYRSEYGIQLVEEGYGKLIFFTGAWCPDIQGIHADRGKLLALSQGLSASTIATDSTDVNSTYQEATRLKELIDNSQNPVKSVIIVSDPFHMRRAKWTYRRILGDNVEVQMAPVPFEMTSYTMRWWENWTSLKMVEEEYVKYIYYLLRYGLNWTPLSNWLATFDRD
jgi:uncharacterized SAM-binding protein YcdF (DUF218 family)